MSMMDISDSIIQLTGGIRSQVLEITFGRSNAVEILEDLVARMS